MSTFGGTAPFDTPVNWSSRGYLPHYDAEGKYQMITYRLSDSLPEEVLERIDPGSAYPQRGNAEVLGAPHSDAASKDPELETKRRKMIEKYLDAGHGCCILAVSEIAKEVIAGWKYFDGERYDLVACVVMPNHVHLLVKTYGGWPIGKLVWSWKTHVSSFVNKRYTLAEINEALQSTRHVPHRSAALPALSAIPNPLWQREYWDRFIRDESHFNKAVAYIDENPVKAGLTQNNEESTNTL